MAVKKIYNYSANITFECEYPDIDTAVKSSEPNSFDKFVVNELKLNNSLIKKGETDASDVSTSTSSK